MIGLEYNPLRFEILRVDTTVFTSSVCEVACEEDWRCSLWRYSLVEASNIIFTGSDDLGEEIHEACHLYRSTESELDINEGNVDLLIGEKESFQNAFQIWISRQGFKLRGKL